MKYILPFIALALILGCNIFRKLGDPNWISLFDGQTLNGWKAGENSATITVENGCIVVHGDRSQLFYDGTVMNHDFKDFEFEAEVMTTPGSNSGIFFDTRFQELGWPAKGYEAQVNNRYTDWRRTGCLYDVQDIKISLAKDNVWFRENLSVQGKKVIAKINDKTVMEYSERLSLNTPRSEQKRLSSGTFALQGHDPKSKVYFKNIRVKPL